jgi:hypothetical protein
MAIKQFPTYQKYIEWFEIFSCTKTPLTEEQFYGSVRYCSDQGGVPETKSITEVIELLEAKLAVYNRQLEEEGDKNSINSSRSECLQRIAVAKLQQKIVGRTPQKDKWDRHIERWIYDNSGEYKQRIILDTEFRKECWPGHKELITDNSEAIEQHEEINYNKKLAATHSSRSRRKGLLWGGAIASIGVLIFSLSGNNGFVKLAGISTGSLGGLVLVAMAIIDVNDSDEAEAARKKEETNHQFKQKREKIIAEQTQFFEQEIQEEIARRAASFAELPESMICSSEFRESLNYVDQMCLDVLVKQSRETGINNPTVKDLLSFAGAALYTVLAIGVNS